MGTPRRGILANQRRHKRRAGAVRPRLFSSTYPAVSRLTTWLTRLGVPIGKQNACGCGLLIGVGRISAILLSRLRVRRERRSALILARRAASIEIIDFWSYFTAIVSTLAIVARECGSSRSHHHQGRHNGRRNQQTDALNHA